MTDGITRTSVAAIWATMATEVMAVMYDLRWMIALSAILILSDFWWGFSEYRYRRARVQGKERETLKFRFSLAGRRTLNKTVDYLTYMLVGSVVGLAIVEPLGGCSHIITAALGLSLGCIFDISSIIGHVCVVHDIEPPKWTAGGMARFVVRFVATFLKKKSPDAGEALEEVINKTMQEDNK